MACSRPRISSTVVVLLCSALIGYLPHVRSLSNFTCFTCNNCPAVTSETSRTFCSELLAARLEPYCTTTFTNDGAIRRGCGKPDASFQDGCRNHTNANNMDSELICSCNSNLCNRNRTRVPSYVRSNVTALPTVSTPSPQLETKFLYQNSDNNRFPNESAFTAQPQFVDKREVLEQENISKQIHEEAGEEFPDTDDSPKLGHNSSQNTYSLSSHDFTEAEVEAVLVDVLVHVVLKCVFVGVNGFIL